jgi:predicted nucleic acid-binding Zn ribbon protein
MDSSKLISVSNPVYSYMTHSGHTTVNLIRHREQSGYTGNLECSSAFCRTLSLP